jgi:hypothetical protein
MNQQLITSGIVATLGLGCLVVAVVHERRMHRHRQPGVTYRQATFRRDGGWRRADLFTDVGLWHQRRASSYGITGAILLCASILAWVVLGLRPSTRVRAANEPPQSPAAEAGFSYSRDVGVVQNARDSTLCLTIANASLAAGERLAVVSMLTDGPQSTATVRVEGRRANACTMPGDEWGSIAIQAASFYTVRVVRDSLLGEPAIVLKTSAPLSLQGRTVTGDLDGDGRPERFSQCTSHEGIHFRVTTRVDGREIERWHEYFYVPYDLEPNCPGMREQ